MLTCKVGYPQITNLNFRRCANLIDVTLLCDNYTNFKSVAMNEVLRARSDSRKRMNHVKNLVKIWLCVIVS